MNFIRFRTFLYLQWIINEINSNYIFLSSSTIFASFNIRKRYVSNKFRNNVKISLTILLYLNRLFQTRYNTINHFAGLFFLVLWHLQSRITIRKLFPFAVSIVLPFTFPFQLPQSLNCQPNRKIGKDKDRCLEYEFYDSRLLSIEKI